ncbi:MAG: glycosyltransferase family 2 protein [Rhodanobacteraceae bacterium]
MNKSPRYCVLIPCLNEERAIDTLLQEVLAYCPDVIVVDDGSNDRTPEIVSKLPVTLLRHATRRGKGEALRTGFREALVRGYDAVLTMDGDGQHAPEDIPRMVGAALRFPDHIVIGARLLNRVQQPTGRRLANAFADWGISWGCGKPVADTQSGQRWYPRAAMELVALRSQDFVFETAILIAACRDLDMRVVSVPIESRYAGEFRLSHFRPVRDVARIALYTVGRIAHYGNIAASYCRSHGTPPLVHDPEGLCGALDVQPARVGPG